jgi:hypothetical protein
VTSRRVAGVVALVTAVVGVALVIAGLTPRTSAPEPRPTVAQEAGSRPAPRSPKPQADEPGEQEDKAGVEDLVTGPLLPSAVPVSIDIPRLHVFSRLEDLGVDDDGVMEVPAEPANAGWYELGPSPGALGPAVVAGHVTWNQAPAVFFRLAELRPGDVVQVTRTDDVVAVFEVTRVARYPKTAFPTDVVFGAIDHAGLRLITCGGDYEQAAHRYTDNVVAFARLTGWHRSQQQ